MARDAGMRDKLAHDYFGVDLDLVWDVAAVELPAARTRIVVLGSGWTRRGRPEGSCRGRPRWHR